MPDDNRWERLSKLAVFLFLFFCFIGFHVDQNYEETA